MPPSLLAFLYQTCQSLIKKNLTKPYSIVGREARGRGGGGIKYSFIYYFFLWSLQDAAFFYDSTRSSLGKKDETYSKGFFSQISQLQSWPKTLDKLPTRLKKVLAFPIEFPVSQAYCYFFNPQ